MGLLDGFLGKDWQDPQSQAVMALAGGLLSGNFGQGAKDYGNVLAGAKDADLKRQMLKAQLDDYSAQAGLRQEQANQIKAKAAQEQRIQSIISGAGKVRPGMGATNMVNDSLPPEMQIGAQPALQKAGQIDYLDLIRQGVPFERVKELASAGDLGKSEVARVQEVEGPNGQKVLQGFDKFGRPVDQGVNGYTAPQLVNQGDRQTFVKPSAGVSLPMGQSPDSKASNALGWANNALSRERFAFDKNGGAEALKAAKPEWRDGQWVMAPRDMNPGETRAVVAPAATRDAKEALALIATAKEIIPKSTGSYLGAGVDQAARLFGASTGGDTAAAQLKALEGALVSKMPKMSGPQSDKDVLLYKQMAGEIGDPTIPQSRKLAALQVIEQIQQRHSGQPAPSSQITPTNAPTMRWNPKTSKIEMVN